jgi:hypothetical protein
MGNIVDTLKDKLDVTIASVKSDIGLFLQQEARVRQMSPGITREGLLSRIKEIETRATSTLARASALSEQIGKFDPWAVSTYAAIARVSPEAVKAGGALLEIKSDMNALVRDADAAMGGGTPPYTPPASSGSLPRWAAYAALAAVPLGFLAVGYLEARRRMRAR